MSEHPGYVKLWRKTLDSGLLQDQCAWQLFGYILLSCKWKPKPELHRRKYIMLHPGQLAEPGRKTAKELKMPYQRMRTALKLLATMDIISIDSTQGTTVITLKNWSKFQTESEELTQSQRKANASLTQSTPKTVVAEGEIGAEEGKKERTIYPKKTELKKRMGTYERNLTLSQYYPVFDPRHPGWSEVRDNKTLRAEWEAKNGPWSPQPDFNEDAQ